MNGMLSLWLPVVATAVFIFIASSLIHMVFKWHNSEYRKFANEDQVRDAIRAGSPVPGQYITPHCVDMKDLKDEALAKKFVDGPITFVTIKKSGPPTMGTALVLWFLFSMLVAAIAGCVACHSFGIKADPRQAGQLVGILTVLTYAGGSVCQGIWMAKPWSSVAKEVLDALIYGLISGLTFMWLWP